MRVSSQQAALDKLVMAIVKLGALDIPREVTVAGMSEYGSILSRIVDRRQQLASVEARILIQHTSWQAEFKGREADYKIKVDDLVENDPHVRSSPNKEGRMARARSAAIDERRSMEEARKESAIWGSLLTVCARTREDLKNAKESVARICHIIEMELGANMGAGTFPQGV